MGKDEILDSYNPVLYDGHFSQSDFISQYSPLLDDYENHRMRRREAHLESLNQNNDLVSSSIRCSSQLQSRINSINLARTNSLFTGGIPILLLTRYDIGFRGGLQFVILLFTQRIFSGYLKILKLDLFYRPLIS